MAADNGLVARANTKFRSQEKITRAEALAMLMKAGNISIKLNCGDCG
jgi:phage terminase large subunit-like protein